MSFKLKHLLLGSIILPTLYSCSSMNKNEGPNSKVIADALTTMERTRDYKKVLLVLNKLSPEDDQTYRYSVYKDSKMDETASVKVSKKQLMDYFKSYNLAMTDLSACKSPLTGSNELKYTMLLECYSKKTIREPENFKTEEINFLNGNKSYVTITGYTTTTCNGNSATTNFPNAILFRCELNNKEKSINEILQKEKSTHTEQYYMDLAKKTQEEDDKKANNGNSELAILCNLENGEKVIEEGFKKEEKLAKEVGFKDESEFAKLKHAKITIRREFNRNLELYKNKTGKSFNKTECKRIALENEAN